MSESEEDKMAMEEIPSRKEFFDLFKPKENGNFDVLGFEFDQMEIAVAKDFYAMCESLAIFYLPRKELAHFLNEFEVQKNIGARLVLAIILRQEDSGYYLLQEDDKRLIGVAKKRLKNEKWGVDMDCSLILPN